MFGAIVTLFVELGGLISDDEYLQTTLSLAACMTPDEELTTTYYGYSSERLYDQCLPTTKSYACVCVTTDGSCKFFYGGIAKESCHQVLHKYPAQLKAVVGVDILAFLSIFLLVLVTAGPTCCCKQHCGGAATVYPSLPVPAPPHGYNSGLQMPAINNYDYNAQSAGYRPVPSADGRGVIFIPRSAAAPMIPSLTNISYVSEEPIAATATIIGQSSNEIPVANVVAIYSL
jgi:hypothetical protein